MARNRKRAKERQRSRAGAAAARRSATARGPGLEDDVPESIRHAAPDVELAEAQLALGRPELQPDAEPEPVEDASVDAESEPLDDRDFGEGPGSPGVLPEQVRIETDPDGGAEALPAAPVAAKPAERRARSGNRLINFLQGSWREL
ncbi:MAG: hypothetical protein ACXVUL_20625, partial [Solirubrobacteraceae bacterium]